ncbi:hypothetical protein VW603_004412 [Salmonella enterica]|nr:hypothetical protein [Salmonella enterica]EMD9041376.1 hypothetical protein [Salmonella enterica]
MRKQLLVDLYPFTLQGIDRSCHIDGIPQRDSCLPPQLAGSLMVHALKLAAERDDISVVARGLDTLLREPGEPDLEKLMRYLGIEDKALPPGEVVQHKLSSYEQLLSDGRTLQ